MPRFTYDGTSLHYEVYGGGFPLLLIAPGGMRSGIEVWSRAPWNPIEQLSGLYRVIAMDQRNAGSSVGPVSGSDGWGTYTADQLALLDHLGVERFHVLGMCIGGAYIVHLVYRAPTRVVSAVTLQPTGLDGNRAAFLELFDGWAAEQRAAHPEAAESDWAGFRSGMFGSDDILLSVSTAEVATFTTPFLVLMGDDLYHPQSASRTLAATAPNATLVERWKDPEHQPAARAAVEQFLAENTPA